MDILDLYPTAITMKNLYCFRGVQSAEDLQASVYAVMAQADDNPARSNWLGKSTFLLAFAYCLFGWHTKRTDDEIITTGEPDCLVKMVLNDGTIIVRSKERGKSEQLKFIAPGAKPITQAQAQTAIEAHIGVTKDNFFAMYFFEQKKIGALVTARGAERTSIIEGWLAEELEPIQRLNDAAVLEHKKASDEHAMLEKELSDLTADWNQLQTDLIGKVDPGNDVRATIDGMLIKALKSQAEKKQELEDARKLALEAAVSDAAWKEKVRQKGTYDSIVEEGIQLRSTFDSLPKDAQKKYEQASGKLEAATSAFNIAKAELDRLEKSDFVFDGKCPIACQDCPSAKWVSSQATSPEALKAAKEKHAAALTARNNASVEARQAKQGAAQRSEIETKLTALRAKAEQLSAVAAEVEASQSQDEEPAKEDPIPALEETLEALSDRVKALEADKVWAAKAVARVWELQTFIHHAEDRRSLATEAVQLTGRTGAQQAIQELVMAKIESKSNDLLTNAGIPLQIEVRWEQETKGLAKVCPKCGTAFPTSQRVRNCATCGEARGPNVQSKMSIEPSNRSGAAEDLAGVALGISASQWLRAQRGARWATVFIDEPFGALDAHNRMALGSHIAGMLRSAFASAFVVAHERMVMTAMPAQIKIAASQTGSRIEGTVS